MDKEDLKHIGCLMSIMAFIGMGGMVVYLAFWLGLIGGAAYILKSMGFYDY